MSNFEKCIKFKVELKGKLDKKLAKRIENKILETWYQLNENDSGKTLTFKISHINLDSDTNENSIFFMDSINKGHFVIISTFFHVKLKSKLQKLYVFKLNLNQYSVPVILKINKISSIWLFIVN